MYSGFRYAISSVLAIVVTLSIFYCLQLLIRASEAAPPHSYPTGTITFSDVVLPDTSALICDLKPPLPKPTQPPPTPAEPPSSQLLISEIPSIPVFGPEGPGFLENHQRGHVNGDSDVVVSVAIQPPYPREAVLRNIEGWAEVAFVITPSGTVKNPRVINSSHPGVFDAAVLQTILQWKFKPRFIKGVAVQRRATQIFEFKLSQAEKI